MRSFRSVVVLAALTVFAIASVAQSPTRIPLPNNSPFPISQGVWVGNTLYLSGTLDPDFSKPPAKDTKAAAANVKCTGVNECKGKGACAGAGNACAGKNECKGKGVTSMTEADCKAKGGTVAAATPKK